MAGTIVLLGATGYTGALTARSLVERGARPVLAARSVERLERLASQLGGLETQAADVERPGTVQALVGRGDVLVTTVGPFERWGDAAAEAAIAAGAHYLDSAGEPAFIRRVFQRHGPAAAAAECGMVTAFGFDWVPGNLAGGLALAEAGPEAVRVDVGYFTRGPTGTSGGTKASAVGVVLEPSFAFRGGRLRSERTGARRGTFELRGRPRQGISVGGSEHFALPALHPTLRDVDVVIGLPGWRGRMAPVATGALSLATLLPPARAALRAILQRHVQGSTGGPDAETRAASGTLVVADARSASGALLRRVRLDGPDPYDFTARILAWGSTTAADRGLHGAGALGPVAAFGLDTLQAGVQEAGFVRSKDA